MGLDCSIAGAALALCASCASALTGQGAGGGDPVLVVGQIETIDEMPMTVDGDALIIVRAEKGNRIAVRIPSGERSCAARGNDQLRVLKPGYKIRLQGRLIRAGELEVCEPDTSIERF